MAMKLKRSTAILMCALMLSQTAVYATEYRDEDGVVCFKPTEGRTPIEELPGYYVARDWNFDGDVIEDEDGRIVDRALRKWKILSVEDKVVENSTPVGMVDSRQGAFRITEDNEVINLVPTDYANVYYFKINGARFLSACFDDYALFPTRYYDFDGNQIEDIEAYLKPYGVSLAIDDWAKSDVGLAYNRGYVADELAYNFKDKITRKEFCRLAVDTVSYYYGCNEHRSLNEADENKPLLEDSYATPFTDIDDYYVSAAAKLGIVSGKGDGTFDPNADITRQEAAVMLANMAEVMGIGGYDKTAKLSFNDKSYFASWASADIDRVCRIKDKDGNAVMSGTGSGKFSPWWGYSREQAIVTMSRLVNCTRQPSDDFIQSFKSDVDTILASYEPGNYTDSLFTKDNIAKYTEKWQALTKNDAERDFVVTLSDVYNITARYYALCDEFKAEGVDEEGIEKAVNRWKYIFTHTLIDPQSSSESYIGSEGSNAYYTFDESTEYAERAVAIWQKMLDDGIINATYYERHSERYQRSLKLDTDED
jgi:hypothetical protein